MNKVQSKTITIGPVRVSYHSLITPRSQSWNTEDVKYSLTMLIPKSDLATKSAIDTAIEFTASEALHTKWNGAAPISLIAPLHDGDGIRPNGEPYGSECAGCYVMNANSKEQPEIVDSNLRPVLNKNEIYSGMWVYVSINFFAYMRSGKKGIGCGLGPVMKFKDDEPLSGRLTAKKAFASLMQPAILNETSPSGRPPFSTQ